MPSASPRSSEPNYKTTSRFEGDVEYLRRREYWGQQVADLVLAIARQVDGCDIRLDDPFWIENVLHRSKATFPNADPRSIEKLRAFITIYLCVRRKAMNELGYRELVALIGEIPSRLHCLYGPPLPRDHRRARAEASFDFAAVDSLLPRTAPIRTSLSAANA
jgi:hypothetical protein